MFMASNGIICEIKLDPNFLYLDKLTLKPMDVYQKGSGGSIWIEHGLLMLFYDVGSNFAVNDHRMQVLIFYIMSPGMYVSKFCPVKCSFKNIKQTIYIYWDSKFFLHIMTSVFISFVAGEDEQQQKSMSSQATVDPHR